MPQAALPDLNTQWIINTREVWTAIKQKNYNSLFGALFAINAMMPKEYQVEISDLKYYSKIKQDVILICKSCSLVCPHCVGKGGDCIAETNLHDTKVRDLDTSLFVRLMLNTKNEKIWHCTKCDTNNILSKTQMIQTVMKEPFYLRMVPSPPGRKDGILDRRTYHKKVERWALQFLNELEHQM